MTEVGISFEILEEVQGVPPGWKKVTGPLVWDINMDFTWKSRWVLDGHKLPTMLDPDMLESYPGKVCALHSHIQH